MLARVGCMFCLLILATGCGSDSTGPSLYAIVGEVTFDGKPVETGRVDFRQMEGDRKAFSGEIKDGTYEVLAEAGKMTVEIRASRLIEGKFDMSNGEPEPVGEMYIPAKYNSATTLVAEVSESGENSIPFALTSK